jgi:ribosomal protein L18
MDKDTAASTGSIIAITATRTATAESTVNDRQAPSTHGRVRRRWLVIEEAHQWRMDQYWAVR